MIPASTDDEGLAWIKAQPNITIAMHGITHEEKEECSMFGKHYTRLGRPMHFVAPFNDIDTRIAALASLSMNVWYNTGPFYSCTKWKMDPSMVPLMESLPPVLDAPGQEIITLHLISPEEFLCTNG